MLAGTNSMAHIPTNSSLSMSRAANSSGSAEKEGENSKAFLTDLFVNTRLKQAFRKLCEDGCEEEKFGVMLHATCLLSSFRADDRYFAKGQKLLVHSGQVSKAQLRSLPKKLREIADLIEKLNASPLAPAHDIEWAPQDPERAPVREYVVRRYETLPGYLRAYCWQLERFQRYARVTARRLTGGHFLAVELVRYVENCTESPHYREVSELLEQGWMLAGQVETAPDFLTVEGLTKLYQRWGDAICGPRKNPHR